MILRRTHTELLYEFLTSYNMWCRNRYVGISKDEIGSVIKTLKFRGNLVTSKDYFSKISLMAQNLPVLQVKL